jgi:hypothetical protein
MNREPGVYCYTSGVITVWQWDYGNRRARCILDERFKTRKALMKILYFLKGKEVEISVIFDEIESEY